MRCAGASRAWSRAPGSNTEALLHGSAQRQHSEEHCECSSSTSVELHCSVWPVRYRPSASRRSDCCCSRVRSNGSRQRSTDASLVRRQEVISRPQAKPDLGDMTDGFRLDDRKVGFVDWPARRICYVNQSEKRFGRDLKDAHYSTRKRGSFRSRRPGWSNCARS